MKKIHVYRPGTGKSFCGLVVGLHSGVKIVRDTTAGKLIGWRGKYTVGDFCAKCVKASEIKAEV